MADIPDDIPALVEAMTEAAYSGCASFGLEVGTICTERNSDRIVWCDKCLLRDVAALTRLARERDEKDARDAAENIGWRPIDEGPVGVGGQIWVAYPNPNHPRGWNLIVEWTPLAHTHLKLHSGCMWRPVDVPPVPSCSEIKINWRPEE